MNLSHGNDKWMCRAFWLVVGELFIFRQLFWKDGPTRPRVKFTWSVYMELVSVSYPDLTSLTLSDSQGSVVQWSDINWYELKMNHSTQGSHGHGKSWKILKFETILESHGKVMDFCLFSRSHGKLIFQGKVMERSWNFTQTVSSVHDVWLWQSGLQLALKRQEPFLSPIGAP